MPETARIELYLIIVTMLLTFVFSTAAMYFFVKTYRKEMRAREFEKEEKRKAADAVDLKSQI